MVAHLVVGERPVDRRQRRPRDPRREHRGDHLDAVRQQDRHHVADADATVTQSLSQSGDRVAELFVGQRCRCIGEARPVGVVANPITQSMDDHDGVTVGDSM